MRRGDVAATAIALLILGQIQEPRQTRLRPPAARNEWPNLSSLEETIARGLKTCRNWYSISMRYIRK
uniref:Uncharacterized protein n=1 Tax=Vespula pensylvanica TaxID=30213 RepID=A0A834MYX1_VESPE|nr:hypothetical protein H0235_017627 [Vespula pensylvanica]